MNFNDNVIISVQKKIKDNAIFKELQQTTKKEEVATPTIITTPVINNIMTSAESELWISKTDEPDIYNIYDNHNILTSNKIGIAFIGSIQNSNMMRNIFKDKSTTLTIKFKCVYNEKFKKYQPIQQLI